MADPEAHVRRRQSQDHQERWQDKRHAHGCSAEHARADVAKINRQLRRKRTRCELRQRQTFQVVFFAHPVPILYQVLLHVSGKSNRSAESHRPKPQKISDELRQWHLLYVGLWCVL